MCSLISNKQSSFQVSEVIDNSQGFMATLTQKQVDSDLSNLLIYILE